MNNPCWIHKFELKQDCWVFIPDDKTKIRGKEIKNAIASKWNPPHYYAHLRRGGHVTALKKHLGNTLFFRTDIEQFFNSVSRTRVTRHLHSLFKDYSLARGMANESTVIRPNHTPKAYVLPYGFVQSAIIASLCLYKSALGKYLNKLEGSGFRVSVYMDDIIVSTSLPLEQAEAALEELRGKATRSRLELNPTKTIGPVESICAFNVTLSQNNIEISNERITEFEEELSNTGEQSVIDGILGYVETISPAQAEYLRCKQ
ncbi:reverse transcriptase domain-containing protein [Gammaproteobacteria bacterium]|nr:reverse transcriptase domain-containing protein [Gammaproteobacteria bacterium]